MIRSGTSKRGGGAPHLCSRSRNEQSRELSETEDIFLPHLLILSLDGIVREDPSLEFVENEVGNLELDFLLRVDLQHDCTK